MTEIAPTSNVEIRTEPGRSFARQVLADTFKGWFAWISAGWILVLVICAVLAPFLANSHPYLLKQEGQWSSPLLIYLQPVDMVLLVMGIAVVACAIGRVRFGTAVAGIVWMGALALALSLWPRIPTGELVGGRGTSASATAWALFRGITAPAAIAVVIWLGSKALFADEGTGKLKAVLRIVGVLVLAGLAIYWMAGTPAGAVFFGTAICVLIAFPLRFKASGRIRVIFGVAAALLALLLILFPVSPPGTVNYSQYREDKAAGLTEFVLFAPIPYSPTDRQHEQRGARLREPDANHLMGTDGNGADVFSRIIHASRIALAVGFISTGIAIVIGIVVGGILGFFVGRLDIVGMRLIEIFEAIPTLFLLITIVAFFGRNLYLIMAIIGLTSWTGNARFVRAEFLRLRNLDFVHAARAVGLPLRSILFRHMLPNGVGPLLVAASFGVASAILLESALSFLGLGLVEEPSWGAMLDQARNAGKFVWWLAVYPGLMIFLTVFSYNLIGESLRDALDPKLRGI